MTKTVEELRRAAFKKWFDSLPWVMCEKCSGDKEIAWRGFNAALNAVEIQLPPLNNSHIGGPDSEMGPSYEQVEDAGYDFAIKDCRAAIEQTGLGLRVK